MEDTEKKYCVYEHINLSNNKRYIGITCQPTWKRWGNGYGYKTNKHFWDAIQKYGWQEGFEHKVLLEGLSFEEACAEEKKLIALYDTTNFYKGYNITSGGDIPPMLGKHHSEETKQKISQNKIGKKLNLSCEQRQIRSNFTKQVWDNMTQLEKDQRLEGFRKGHEQYCQKIQKKVRCIETGQIFNNAREASEWATPNKDNHSGISRVCRGKQKTCAGYHWEHIEEEGD